MANVNVSYDEMRSAADRLVAGQGDITAKLNELKGYIGTLIGSGFVTDQASVAFGETYGEFTTNSTQLIGNLTDLGGYLRKAAQTLQETDAALAGGL
jgi:WXG100 family type VII secretion target